MTVWDSHNVFDFRSRFVCFQQPIKKTRVNSKILCPQSPSFLVPSPQPAKRSERGYGNENGNLRDHKRLTNRLQKVYW